MKKLILLILLLTVLFCLPAAAEEQSQVKPVYLVVMSTTNTGNTLFYYVYHTVSSYQECFDIIKNSRVDIPTSGDAEAAIAMFCAPDKGKYQMAKEMGYK